MVLVRPMKLEMPTIPEVPDVQEGLPTDAVLSVLLIKHLQVNGINAVLEASDAAPIRYALSCTIPTLGYEEIAKGYPTTHRYRAELSCALSEPPSEQPVWQRKLEQQYDDTVVLDLMTKLPPEPHKHDRVLYRECIVPLWDAMASSVGAVVRSRARVPVPPAPQVPPQLLVPARETTDTTTGPRSR